MPGFLPQEFCAGLGGESYGQNIQNLDVIGGTASVVLPQRTVLGAQERHLPGLGRRRGNEALAGL